MMAYLDDDDDDDGGGDDDDASLQFILQITACYIL
jgi:hypothetical protein